MRWLLARLADLLVVVGLFDRDAVARERGIAAAVRAHKARCVDPKIMREDDALWCATCVAAGFADAWIHP